MTRYTRVTLGINQHQNVTPPPVIAGDESIRRDDALEVIAVMVPINAWWEVRRRERPNNPDELWDVWLEQSAERVRHLERIKMYGGEFIAMSKRLLSRDEVRELYRKIRSARQLHSKHR